MKEVKRSVSKSLHGGSERMAKAVRTALPRGLTPAPVSRDMGFHAAQTSGSPLVAPLSSLALWLPPIDGFSVRRERGSM